MTSIVYLHRCHGLIAPPNMSFLIKLKLCFQSIARNNMRLKVVPEIKGHLVFDVPSKKVFRIKAILEN